MKRVSGEIGREPKGGETFASRYASSSAQKLFFSHPSMILTESLQSWPDGWPDSGVILTESLLSRS